MAFSGISGDRVSYRGGGMCLVNYFSRSCTGKLIYQASTWKRNPFLEVVEAGE